MSFGKAVWSILWEMRDSFGGSGLARGGKPAAHPLHRYITYEKWGFPTRYTPVTGRYTGRQQETTGLRTTGLRTTGLRTTELRTTDDGPRDDGPWDYSDRTCAGGLSSEKAQKSAPRPAATKK